MTSLITKFKKVSHVIFDLDGVLLDTEIVYAKARDLVCQKFGKSYTTDILSQVKGLPSLQASEKIVNLLKLPLCPTEYNRLAKEQYIHILSDNNLMPGAEKLVTHLHKHKIPMAIATASSERSYLLKIQKHSNMFKLFHHHICGGSDDAVRYNKPNADIYLVCASKFDGNPKPEMCLVFEDSLVGVEAARNAGMQVVFVSDSEEETTCRTTPSVKIKNLLEAPLQLFGLPKMT